MQIFPTARLASAAAVLALAALVAGCKPSGERALIEGDRLLRAGKVAEAVPVLERAVLTLPQDARALNYLGLAYQSAGRADEARRAYLRALEIDRNLFEANHNLGLLYLDKGDLLEAERSLRAYLASRQEDGTAWATLGMIQYRAGRLDEAERSFATAKQFNATGPAEWNMLGMISSQRKRYREARDRFQWVLRLDPRYAPALLNLAILNHQHLGDRQAALANYKAWLAVAPPGSNTAAVIEIIRQLEVQLGLVAPLPPPPRAEPTNNPAPARQLAVVTNPPPSAAQPAAAAPSQAKQVVAIKTNTPAPTTSVRSNPPVEVARQAPVQPPKTQVVAPPTNVPAETVVAPKPTRPVEIVKVEEDAPLRAARDVAPQPQPSPSVPTSGPVASSPASTESAQETIQIPNPTPTLTIGAEAPKRSFWQKANPVSWFRRDDGTRDTLTPLETESPKKAPATVAESTPRAAPPARPALPPPPRLERPVPPRYVRRAPAALPEGNRAAAETEFRQAVEAHRRRDLAAAAAGYRKATTLDPAYFEAHHNLALVALDQGDLSLALLACENALVLKPDENGTRRTFAQALRQAGNTADAAEQIELILEAKPTDVPLHLAAASLYSGELGDDASAKKHYETVLALEPSHPQAGAIRSWLASRP